MWDKKMIRLKYMFDPRIRIKFNSETEAQIFFFRHDNNKKSLYLIHFKKVIYFMPRALITVACSTKQKTRISLGSQQLIWCAASSTFDVPLHRQLETWEEYLCRGGESDHDCIYAQNSSVSEGDLDL